MDVRSAQICSQLTKLVIGTPLLLLLMFIEKSSLDPTFNWLNALVSVSKAFIFLGNVHRSWFDDFHYAP